MSFDQFNTDQVLNFDYFDNNGQRFTGMSVHDRSGVDINDMGRARDSIKKITNGDSVKTMASLMTWLNERSHGVPYDAQRLFVGRDVSKASVVSLSDPNGVPRLQLVVDSTGAARIEFLDKTGQIARTISAP